MRYLTKEEAHRAYPNYEDMKAAFCQQLLPVCMEKLSGVCSERAVIGALEDFFVWSCCSVYSADSINRHEPPTDAQLKRAAIWAEQDAHRYAAEFRMSDTDDLMLILFPDDACEEFLVVAELTFRTAQRLLDGENFADVRYDNRYTEEYISSLYDQMTDHGKRRANPLMHNTRRNVELIEYFTEQQ